MKKKKTKFFFFFPFSAFHCEKKQRLKSKSSNLHSFQPNFFLQDSLGKREQTKRILLSIQERPNQKKIAKLTKTSR